MPVTAQSQMEMMNEAGLHGDPRVMTVRPKSTIQRHSVLGVGMMAESIPKWRQDVCLSRGLSLDVFYSPIWSRSPGRSQGGCSDKV